jgi:GT2 family glycosyltransferase
MTVVILSKTSANLHPCIAAVREHEPDARIVVVDDGLDSVPPDVETVIGVKPFIFARNANLGIAAAGEDDVVLLNDDALLRSQRGFTIMFDQLTHNPEYGLCGASCNSVGNTNQFPRSQGFRFEPRMVCFVCVALPRRTIQRVGLLDERYVQYGFDDDDYCLRVRAAGLRIGISDDCFVDHKHLTSTFRAGGRADMSHNQKLFTQKWGAVR